MKKVFRFLTTFCLSALLAGMAAVTVTADSGVPTALSAKQLEDLPAALRPVSIGAQSPDLLYDLRVREYRDFGEEQVEYQYTELYHTQKVYQTVNDIGADYRKNVYGDAEGNRCEWDEKGRISSFQCAPEVKLFAQNSDLSAVKAYAEERLSEWIPDFSGYAYADHVSPGEGAWILTYRNGLDEYTVYFADGRFLGFEGSFDAAEATPEQEAVFSEMANAYLSEKKDTCISLQTSYKQINGTLLAIYDAVFQSAGGGTYGERFSFGLSV